MGRNHWVMGLVATMAFLFCAWQFPQPSHGETEFLLSKKLAPPSTKSVDEVPSNENLKGLLNSGSNQQKRFPPLDLGKVGAWIQPNSVDSSLAYEFSQWFIADWRVIKEVKQRSAGKPILIAFGHRHLDQVQDVVRENLQLIRGVVLDYEPGATPEKAEKVLLPLYRHLHGLGLKVGISTLARPSSSLKTNGVDFSKAHLFSDFLLPQLYSRIWNNAPSETTRRYLEGLSNSSVPVIPVITYATTEKNPGKVSPEDVVRNYRHLDLPCVVVWNVRDSDRKFWQAVQSLYLRSESKCEWQLLSSNGPRRSL
jgi:hypothetical protein